MGPHEEQQVGEPDDLITVEEAASLLEVAVDRIRIMVDEGMLDPVDDEGAPTFVRAEVIAVRQIGG